ncbi:hypothetical protein, partial [Allosalinactinospora lopnorensis]|uniref:hypothetical protein n=1 Tax=Allosalinactinospora lopnorensis TaxID=1352348 RepID=UPI000623F57E
AEHFGLAHEAPRGAYFLDDDLADRINGELAEFVALRNAGVLDFVHTAAKETSDWTPRMRRQAVEAITRAIESADTDWNSPFQRTFLENAMDEARENADHNAP